MKKIRRYLILGISAGILLSCANDPKDSSIETPEISFHKEGELYLLKSGDTLQKIAVEFAESDYEKQTGLMYRTSLGDNEGMLFIYASEAMRSFYMKNTYIPLDIIFYNKDSAVVSFQENARPLDETSLPSTVPAQFILELNAGKVKEWNIEVGDKIDFKKD
tara:strand:+ start:1221 stop:1706 length:486 start_codon:yes stop_codon:yes gene_type:complete